MVGILFTVPKEVCFDSKASLKYVTKGQLFFFSGLPNPGFFVAHITCLAQVRITLNTLKTVHVAKEVKKFRDLRMQFT